MSDTTATTHTPGPWKYKIPPKKDRAYILDASDNVPSVARCLPRGPGVLEANARLIASAPMMLDALQGMVNQVNYMLERNGGEIEGYSDTSSFSAMDHARRAIAKATGGDA